MKKVGIGLMVILVAAAFGFVIYMNGKMYDKMNALQKAWEDEINSRNAEEENDNGEDVIGGQYVIRDTSPVSDAYKSGDTSKLDDQQKETYDMAVEVLKSVIKDGMTPYEKELAIYHWIIKNITYDSGSFVAVARGETEKDTPHGVLKSKQAVCVGFATTFRLFMQMLDIPCVVVPDTELSHSWNRVELEGEWYNVDCTFDVSGDEDLDEDGGNYRNFNICDSVFSQDHSWNMEAYPEGTGTKYNYVVQNAKTLEDIFELPKMMKSRMKKKKAYLFVEVPIDVEGELVDAAVYGVMSRVKKGAPADYFALPKDDKHYVLAIFFDRSAAETQSTVSKDIKKMEKKLNKIFGPVLDDYDDYDDY